MVEQFLTMMDGPGSSNNIFIIGTTNRIDLMDEAFFRGGRFATCINVEIPDILSRLEMLEVILQESKDDYELDDDVDTEELAILTKGFAASSLSDLLSKAYSYAFQRNGHKHLDLKYKREDFIRAINQIQLMKECVAAERNPGSSAHPNNGFKEKVDDVSSRLGKLEKEQKSNAETINRRFAMVDQVDKLVKEAKNQLGEHSSVLGQLKGRVADILNTQEQLVKNHKELFENHHQLRKDHQQLRKDHHKLCEDHHQLYEDHQKLHPGKASSE